MLLNILLASLICILSMQQSVNIKMYPCYSLYFNTDTLHCKTPILFFKYYFAIRITTSVISFVIIPTLPISLTAITLLHSQAPVVRFLLNRYAVFPAYSTPTFSHASGIPSPSESQPDSLDSTTTPPADR